MSRSVAPEKTRRASHRVLLTAIPLLFAATALASTRGDPGDTIFLNGFEGPPNQPPLVDAGPDQTLTADAGSQLAVATLAGSASDDALAPWTTLDWQWSLVSAPGTPPMLGFDAAGATPGIDLLAPTVRFAAPGQYVIALTAGDGQLSSVDTVTITVEPAANLAPVLRDPGQRVLPIGGTLELTLAADDPNSGDTLTYALTSAPAGAVLDPAGSPNVRFAPGATGDYAFTARVADDAGLSDEKSFVLSVVPSNRRPVFGALPSASIAAAVSFSHVLTASDPDGDSPLAFSLLAGPPGMSLTDATLTWTPLPDQLGDATVKVRVADPAGARSEALFTLTVIANVPPVARDDEYETRIGDTLDVPAPGVLVNDVEPDGQSLTAAKLSDPPLGTLDAFVPAGAFHYTAPAVPPPPAFALQVKFWNKSPGFQPYTQALVADMNGAGIPDVVGIQYNNNLFVQRGTDGGRRTEWIIPGACPFHWLANGESSMALGNVDDDPAGTVEYVSICTDRTVAAFGANGVVRWHSADLLSAFPAAMAPGYIEQHTPTLARLSAGGGVKVFLAVAVQNVIGPAPNNGCYTLTGDDAHRGRGCHAVIQLNGATGAIERRMSVLWPTGSPTVVQSVNDFARGFLTTTVADIDGDGVVEIVSGPSVWNNDGTLRWTKVLNPPDTGVADLDGDGRAEIVMMANPPTHTLAANKLIVFDADGVERFQIPFYPDTSGGYVRFRMTIADVDGDERPEIVVPAETALWVIDGQGRIRWIRGFSPDPLSSTRFQTGHRPLVFDLDNDGTPEIVTKNSDQLLVLNGSDGTTKAKFRLLGLPPNDTAADNNPNVKWQTPVIADIDADGHADIAMNLANRPGSGGLLVVSGAANDWAPAPRVWNQPTYNPRTVDDAGQILFDATVPTSYVQQRRLATPTDTRGPDVTTFTYAASDGGLASQPATVAITLKPANRPPAITSPFPPATRPPGQFFLNFAATDPDPGDVLTWAIAFDGCPVSTLNAGTGAFSSFATAAGPCQYTVTVTDSQGAQDTQFFSVRGTTATTIVPDLTGLTEAEVLLAMQVSNLAFGDIQRIFHGAPPDTVVTQAPAAGTTQPVGTRVDITLSRGPEPVVLPNVVQKAAPLALAQLDALGLTTQVTRVFSDDVPAEQVMLQSPAAGTTVVPLPSNPVALTVSAGNGLALSLDRGAVTAGQSIGVTARATNPDGSPATLPALTWTITPRYLPATGTAPGYAGGTISTAADTLGAYTVTAHDAAANRTASAGFAVMVASPPGQDSATALHAQLASVLEGIEEIGRDLRIAQATNDEPAMTQGVIDLVTLWRTIDVADLRLAPPVVLPEGFLPTPEEMLAFGVLPGPDDALVRQVLADGAADLDAWTKGLKAPGTTLVSLRQMADQFSTRAARLRSLDVSEYGTVAAMPEYVLLLNHRIPAFYEALTNELAPVVGLPRRAPDFPLAEPGDDDGEPGEGGGAGMKSRARAKSTLAELAVTQAVGYVTDKIMEKGSEIYRNARQFARDIYGQAAYSAAALAAAQHLRAFVQGLDLHEVVSGASLSFRVFGPPAFIEVPGNVESPDLNGVMVIGKTLLEQTGGSIQTLFDAIKTSYSQGVDAAGNAARCKNGNDCFAKVKALIDQMQATLQDPAQNLFDVAQSFYQRPTHVELGCVFTGDPYCVQLHYANGFRSVYQYSPPPTLGEFTGLPAPVIVIVQDEVTGVMYFGTPVFFPSPPPSP